jgi:hypothetical protein
MIADVVYALHAKKIFEAGSHERWQVSKVRY